MLEMKIKLALLLLFVLGAMGTKAQESITSSGGDASSSAGSISYSIGQIVYTTVSKINGSISQGVQQVFEISVVSNIEEASVASLSISLFPNPTNEYVNLKVDNTNIENMSYFLYDINGKLIGNNKVSANITSISMINLVSETYFLKVIQNNNEIKTFKIIKN